jgi:hypothetical protein
MKYDNASNKYDGEWTNGVPNAAEFAQQNAPAGLGGFGVPPAMPGGMSVAGGAASVVHNGNATVMSAPTMSRMGPVPFPHGPATMMGRPMAYPQGQFFPQNMQYGSMPNMHGGFVPPSMMGPQGIAQPGMQQPQYLPQGMMPQGLQTMPPQQQQQQQPVINNCQQQPTMVRPQSMGSISGHVPGEEQTLPMKSPAPGGLS